MNNLNMNNINKTTLYQLVDSLVKSYLQTNNEPTTEVKNIYIVGSYLTEDFIEGESDLDIFIETEDSMTKETREFFWEFFNDCHLQQNLQNCVSEDITMVDCVGIGKWRQKQNNTYQQI